MADFDPKLANRILWGLVLGAVAGALVLIVGAAIPAVLEGAQWLSGARPARSGFFKAAIFCGHATRLCIARLGCCAVK